MVAQKTCPEQTEFYFQECGAPFQLAVSVVYWICRARQYSAGRLADSSQVKLLMQSQSEVET
jgi:hypothetical protein